MAACSGQPHALSPAPARASVSFLLNGAPVEVHDPDPSETLLQYLRRSAHLKGTKGVCLQGGCGACTVLLSSPAPVALPAPGEGGAEPSVSHRAVNSCLRPLCSVDGMSVTTVEGVGSTTTALHPVQQQMVDHNASQCGYCTSGFVSGPRNHAHRQRPSRRLQKLKAGTGPLRHIPAHLPLPL